jgi:polyhydroxyalkanoate synthase
MARNPRTNTEEVAAKLRESQQKFSETLSGEGASQQVMSGFAEAYRAWLEAMSAKPQTMMDLQGRYMQEQMKLWMGAMHGSPDGEPPPDPSPDKRFSAPEWNALPVFRYFRDSYLLTSKMMMQAVEEANLDAPTKQRMRFFMRQYLDAAAPSNYLMTNPEALKAALESRGETLQEGMKNLMADMEKGRISMTDEGAFEVGRNIATTPGSVVFENELLQLIQYVPTTAKVHERPLVMVPPCINKYYLMDLQPENSLVKYVVEQGHTRSWSRGAT